MSPKQLRTLVVVLVALLLLWGGSRLLSRGSDVVRGSLTLGGVTSGNADSIVIRHAADTIRLVRAGEVWSVNGYRASLQAVQDLLLALRDSTPPEVAAVSPTSFARMEVDSAGGWWLRVTSGAAAAHPVQLVIGRSGPGSSSGYVRRPGSDTVYLWTGQLPELARRPLEQWRDHRIAAVTPDSVRDVTIERGKRRYELRQVGKQWQVAGAAADSATVAAYLGRFRDLQASGFATPAQADSAARGTAERRVTLSGASGAPLLALSFDSTAGAFWVRRDGDSTVYRLGSWEVDPLTPADSTFRPAPAKSSAAAPAKPR